MKNPLRKQTASLTLILFIISQISNPFSAQAQTLNPTSEVSIPAFQMDIPNTMGSVEAVVSGQGPTLFHVQTAHGNYEAQKNIQAILHHLNKNYGVDLVLMEGSSTKLNPEIIRFFPDDMELTLEIAEDLTKKALVKGAELFLLESDGVEAYGIEDLEAYSVNGHAFRAVLNQREQTLAFVQDMDQQIERLASPYLNKELRSFIKRLESFEAKIVNFSDWLMYLGKQAKTKLGVDLQDEVYQIQWPMLVRIFKLMQFEAKIHPKKLIRERKAFLKKIKRMPKAQREKIELLLTSPAARQGVSDVEVNRLVEAMISHLPVNFNYDAFPNVKYMIGHILLQSEVRGERLTREMNELTDLISTSMAKSRIERRVLELLKDHRLVKKLFALELTPTEYDQLKVELRPSVMIQSFVDLNQSNRVRNVEFGNIAQVDQLFDVAVEFYRGVKARDGWMIQNIQKVMLETGRDKAVVITGGFHSGPFKQFFAGQGYNYALIAPKISDHSGRKEYIQTVLQRDVPTVKGSTLENLNLAEAAVVRGQTGLVDSEFMARSLAPSFTSAALKRRLQKKAGHNVALTRLKNRKAYSARFTPHPVTGLLPVGAEAIVPVDSKRPIEVRPLALAASELRSMPNPLEITEAEQVAMRALGEIYEIDNARGEAIETVAVQLAKAISKEILPRGQLTGRILGLMNKPVTAERFRPALYRIFSAKDRLIVSDAHATVEGVTKLALAVPNSPIDHNGDFVDRGNHFDKMLAAGESFAASRVIGNHDMVSSGAFLGDISNFGEWLRWQLAYGNDDLVETTYGIDLAQFRAYADEKYGALKKGDSDVGALITDDAEIAAVKASGGLEDHADVTTPARLGSIYAMAALNFHLKNAGNLIGLSKVPFGLIAIDETLEAELVEEVQTRIIPMVREIPLTEGEITSIAQVTHALQAAGLNADDISKLEQYFRLSKAETDLIQDLMWQMARNTGAQTARKFLQQGKLYHIVEASESLKQIDRAFAEVDSNWKSHPKGLMVHAGIPVTPDGRFYDIDGNTQTVLPDSTIIEQYLVYLDSLQERLDRIYSEYEAAIADTREVFIAYLESHEADFEFLRQLSMGYYSPLYLRNGLEDVVNIYAKTSPFINKDGQPGVGDYKEVDSPLRVELKNAESGTTQILENAAEQAGIDHVILGHINTKKPGPEVYGNGTFINIDDKHTEKGKPSLAGATKKDTATGRGTGLIFGRSVTAIHLNPEMDDAGKKRILDDKPNVRYTVKTLNDRGALPRVLSDGDVAENLGGDGYRDQDFSRHMEEREAARRPSIAEAAGLVRSEVRSDLFQIPRKEMTRLGREGQRFGEAVERADQLLEARQERLSEARQVTTATQSEREPVVRERTQGGDVRGAGSDVIAERAQVRRGGTAAPLLTAPVVFVYPTKSLDAVENLSEMRAYDIALENPQTVLTEVDGQAARLVVQEAGSVAGLANIPGLPDEVQAQIGAADNAAETKLYAVTLQSQEAGQTNLLIGFLANDFSIVGNADVLLGRPTVIRLLSEVGLAPTQGTTFIAPTLTVLYREPVDAAADIAGAQVAGLPTTIATELRVGFASADATDSATTAATAQGIVQPAANVPADTLSAITTQPVGAETPEAIALSESRAALQFVIDDFNVQLFPAEPTVTLLSEQAPDFFQRVAGAVIEILRDRLAIEVDGERVNVSVEPNRGSDEPFFELKSPEGRIIVRDRETDRDRLRFEGRFANPLNRSGQPVLFDGLIQPQSVVEGLAGAGVGVLGQPDQFQKLATNPLKRAAVKLAVRGIVPGDGERESLSEARAQAPQVQVGDFVVTFFVPEVVSRSIKQNVPTLYDALAPAVIAKLQQVINLSVDGKELRGDEITVANEWELGTEPIASVVLPKPRRESYADYLEIRLSVTNPKDPAGGTYSPFNAIVEPAALVESQAVGGNDVDELAALGFIPLGGGSQEQPLSESRSQVLGTTEPSTGESALTRAEAVAQTAELGGVRGTVEDLFTTPAAVDESREINVVSADAEAVAQAQDLFVQIQRTVLTNVGIYRAGVTPLSFLDLSPATQRELLQLILERQVPAPVVLSQEAALDIFSRLLGEGDVAQIDLVDSAYRQMVLTRGKALEPTGGLGFLVVPDEAFVTKMSAKDILRTLILLDTLKGSSGTTHTPVLVATSDAATFHSRLRSVLTNRNSVLRSEQRVLATRYAGEIESLIGVFQVPAGQSTAEAITAFSAENPGVVTLGQNFLDTVDSPLNFVAKKWQRVRAVVPFLLEKLTYISGVARARADAFTDDNLTGNVQAALLRDAPLESRVVTRGGRPYLVLDRLAAFAQAIANTLKVLVAA